jgi:hypothetical protein
VTTLLTWASGELVAARWLVFLALTRTLRSRCNSATHRNLWQNRSFLANFPANASHIFGCRYLCRSVHESVQKPLLAGLRSLATLATGGRIIFLSCVANSAISQRHCREKGKVRRSDFGHRICIQTYRYTYLYPHLFSSPSHWHPRGCPLSVDLVYDPATHRSGHD